MGPIDIVCTKDNYIMEEGSSCKEDVDQDHDRSQESNKRKLNLSPSALIKTKRKRVQAKLQLQAKQVKAPVRSLRRVGRVSIAKAFLERGTQGSKLDVHHSLLHSILVKYERKDRILHHQDPLKRELVPSVVNCMRFDSVGALLATGTNKGDLFLYDFDEYVFENYRNQGNEDDSVEEEKTLKLSKKYQQPLIALPTAFTDIQSLEWNPNDERYLACGGYGALNGINIYNLELQTTKPSQSLRSRQKSGAYTCLTFGCGNHLLYSGTSRGSVKLWDLRKASGPQWEASPYGENRSRSKDAQRKTISSLVLVSNGRHFFSATTSGRIDLWDTRKLKTPLFGAKPVPSTIKHWQSQKMIQSLSHRYALSRGEGIVSMQVNPANPQELGFHLACGWVGVFNRTIGAVSKLCPLQNEANMQSYKVRKMGEDAEAVRLSPVLNSRRNCASFFQTESLFCAALPAERKVYIVDMSPAARRKPAETTIPGHSARGFSITTPDVPNAVVTHPTQDYIIVAPDTADNRIDVLGI